MASYENDQVINEIFNDADLDESTKQLLSDLLQDSSEAEGQVFTGSFTKADLGELASDVPEVIVFETSENPVQVLNVNLAKLPDAERSEIKALVFNTDQSVRLSGLKGFEGVISLGSGSDKVNTGAFSGDVTISTGEGNDSVKTGSGSDSVNIGSGKDTVSTGAGNDQIQSSDTSSGGKVTAGLGNDSILFTSGFSGGFGVRITLDGGKDTDSLDLGALDIASVKKLGKGVQVTLEDQTVLIVKNVESFSYFDGSEIKTVGVMDFNNAFPDAPTS